MSLTDREGLQTVAATTAVAGPGNVIVRTFAPCYRLAMAQIPDFQTTVLTSRNPLYLPARSQQVMKRMFLMMKLEEAGSPGWKLETTTCTRSGKAGNSR